MLCRSAGQAGRVRQHLLAAVELRERGPERRLLQHELRRRRLRDRVLLCRPPPQPAATSSTAPRTISRRMALNITRALRTACSRFTESTHGARVKQVLAAALCALALVPSSAAAAPGLLLGVDDDSLKWYWHTSSLLSIYDGLGLDAVRVTLDWSPGLSFPVGTQRTELQRVATASQRTRIVIAVSGRASSRPSTTPVARRTAEFVANILRRYPSIRDVAIWTEPNSTTFWRPQKGAPAAYEALLAACWDTLHAVAPRRERHRDERAAHRREALVRRPRQGVPREPARAAHLRHRRPQRVPGDLERSADREAQEGLDRPGRPRPPARRAAQGLRQDGAAGARPERCRRSGTWRTASRRSRALAVYTGVENDRSPCRRLGRPASCARPSSSRTASLPSGRSSTSSSATSRRSAAGSRASSGRTGARSPSFAAYAAGDSRRRRARYRSLR